MNEEIEMLRAKRVELESYVVDSLKDLRDYYTGYGSDIHNEIANTDYYIIGTYLAEQWLSSDVFEIMGIIKEYELNTFGEVLTDISSSEAVVNMYVYIVCEEILSLSDYLNEECFDRYVDPSDIDSIIEDLQ